MPIVRAGPDEYLLIGRSGRLENRGSAVRAFLLPGAIHVVVPASKQEATFEFTQETKDGIPLRFKGIVVYRIVEPIAAARQFDFRHPAGLARIGTLITHVCLGELRHAVSHMTMVECIEERKTTLTQVVVSALEATLQPADDPSSGWGIAIDVAQVAQVFIVDADLRLQLEAEVRDEIKLRSDRSHLQAAEQTDLAEMASRDRVDEERLAADREKLRRDEELEVARLERDRRLAVERTATRRQELGLELEAYQASMESEQEKVRAEAPARLLRIETERAILAADLETRRLRNDVHSLEVDHDLLLPRAEQEMRREILPLEQAPRIVEAASSVLRDTNLTVYADEAQLLGRLVPLFDLIGDAVARSTASPARTHRRDTDAAGTSA